LNGLSPKAAKINEPPEAFLAACDPVVNLNPFDKISIVFPPFVSALVRCGYVSQYTGLYELRAVL
jgi:hypothetical protein